MKPRIRQLVASLLLGLALTLGLVGLLVALDTEALGLLVARADPGDIYCVALGGGAYSDCDQVFTSVQAALDAASGGEEIRVASGTYTDLHVRAGVTQVVYVDKTVTIRGGYATTDWNTPDPAARPTTLDAQRQGRVLYITGNLTATIEGLCITNGDADGLLGDPSGFDAGGGVYVYAATVNLSNNQIFSNTAVTGGGLYALEGEDMALNGNTIISNTVYHSGGGLTLRDSPGPTLINNTISFNKATHRGDGAQNTTEGSISCQARARYLLTTQSTATRPPTRVAESPSKAGVSVRR
jgi:parallel beta-helix repeat protein